MRHVLIIEDDISVANIIEARLIEYGISSFSYAWTEDDALRTAQDRRPDLVVVCDGADIGSSMCAAQSVSEKYGVPALFVTGRAATAKRSLPRGCSLGGPFLLPELSCALAYARPC